MRPFAMVIPTRGREGFLHFTSPWLSIPQVVAIRDDQIYVSGIKQIIGQEIGVVSGLATKDILLASYPGIKLVEVEDVLGGLRRVAEGKLFGFIDTLPTISRALQTEPVPGVKISGDIGLNVDYVVGVRGGDPRLLSILERSVSFSAKNQISNIYNRWLAVAYIDRFNYTLFWQVLFAVLLAGLYGFYRFRKGGRLNAELMAAHAVAEAANRELDKKNQILDLQARTDALAGLSNRMQTDEQLHNEQERFERYGVIFSILLLDLDHFKKVNDTHGHQVGD